MELKFRAWEHNTKRMIEDVAVRNGLIHNHKNIFYRLRHDTNYKITQSLGFPDKEGNELFIGDIIKIQIHPDDDVSIFKITKLKFGIGVFYKGWNEEDPMTHFAKFDEFHLKHGFKIGNIFANPELMQDQVWLLSLKDEDQIFLKEINKSVSKNTSDIKKAKIFRSKKDALLFNHNELYNKYEAYFKNEVG